MDIGRCAFHTENIGHNKYGPIDGGQAFDDDGNSSDNNNSEPPEPKRSTYPIFLSSGKQVLLCAIWDEDIT